MAGGVLTGCSTSGGHSAPTTVPASTSTVATTTTVPGVQTTGTRTVLSPIGLHVRAAPSRTAKVLGTASQGVGLRVLGYNAVDGGWYQVRGSTVTGWITASGTLSAAGTFSTYSPASGAFALLYPASWASTGPAPGTWVFRAPTGAERVTVRLAATVAQLGRGAAGYGEIRSSTVVACGITSLMRTYQRSEPPAAGSVTTVAGSGATEPYLVQARFTLDAKHALGIDGALTDLGQLTDVLAFVDSITFPFPQCQGKA